MTGFVPILHLCPMLHCGPREEIFTLFDLQDALKPMSPAHIREACDLKDRYPARCAKKYPVDPVV